MLNNGGGRGGRFYWVRKDENFVKIKGIVVIFAWVSIQERQLQEIVNLYSSLQWNSLVCLSDFLNPLVYLFEVWRKLWLFLIQCRLSSTNRAIWLCNFGWMSNCLGGINRTLLSDFMLLAAPRIAKSCGIIFPEKATSLAFSVLNELVEELRNMPCPIVLAAFSGGSKACMYKVLQIIQGASEAQLNLGDSQLVMNCISGQIYDSSPDDFTGDLGARFALHPTILRMPGSAKLASLIAKGVTSSLDALFLTRFGSQRSEYWQTLYSSVSLGSPYLIICSENDNIASYPIICNFAQRLQDLGGSVQLVKLNGSTHVGHYNHCPIQYQAAVTELLEKAVSVFAGKIQKYGERTGLEGMHDEISDLICDLQSAAVDSNQSLRRVALGPNDHFFLPSSAEHQTGGDSGSLQDERKERLSHSPTPPSISAHSVLGQVLFDACVPKNIEGWDIKFSGSLNGQPLASIRKYSPLNAIKGIRRSRL